MILSHVPPRSKRRLSPAQIGEQAGGSVAARVFEGSADRALQRNAAFQPGSGILGALSPRSFGERKPLQPARLRRGTGRQAFQTAFDLAGGSIGFRVSLQSPPGGCVALEYIPRRGILSALRSKLASRLTVPLILR